jgi:hypothetical protein
MKYKGKYFLTLCSITSCSSKALEQQTCICNKCTSRPMRFAKQQRIHLENVFCCSTTFHSFIHIIWQTDWLSLSCSINHSITEWMNQSINQSFIYSFIHSFIPQYTVLPEQQYFYSIKMLPKVFKLCMHIPCVFLHQTRRVDFDCSESQGHWHQLCLLLAECHDFVLSCAKQRDHMQRRVRVRSHWELHTANDP